MRNFTHILALLCAIVSPLAAVAQGNPFEEKTKAVYIFSVAQKQVLSDYSSLTPKTYMVLDYSPSNIENKLFEITTIDEAAGTYVLYSPATDGYMKVPTSGIGIVTTTTETSERTPIVVKDTEDGHKQLRTVSGNYIAPYRNGNFLMLGALNQAQYTGYVDPVDDAWDFVEPDNLREYLISVGVDPDYDPHNPDPDPDPDPVPTATFEELAQAIRDAEEMLFRIDGGLAPTGSALIETAEQLSSEYSDSEEGLEFLNLIDADYSTFWHSDWHGEAPEGYHSFDVTLPAALPSNLFYAEYCGRLEGNNCAPVEIDVYGAHRDGDQLLWEDTPVASLTRDNGVGAFAGWGHSTDPEALSGHFTFDTGASYDALRFQAVLVVSDSGEGEEACFNYSEFQLFQAEKVAPSLAGADETLVNNLRELVAAARYFVKSEDPTDLVAEIYEAIAALDPSGIASTTATTAPSTLSYDLQGRRLNGSKAQQPGLRIQGGKLQIVR